MTVRFVSGSVPEGISLSPPMSVPGAADPTPRIFA